MDMQRGRQQNEDSEQSRNTRRDHQHGGMIQLVDLALVNAFAPCVQTPVDAWISNVGHGDSTMYQILNLLLIFLEICMS
jgi:hypothetical protein